MLDELVPIRPREATLEELTRFHTEAYVERIRRLSDAGGGEAGENTPFSGGAFEMDRRAGAPEAPCGRTPARGRRVSRTS